MSSLYVKYLYFVNYLPSFVLILGDKKVYWSTSKVASHIRSGHCQGAPEEEVQQFKLEFIYESPKNLVHRSTITKKFKNSFEVEEFCPEKKAKPCEKRVIQSVKEIKDDALEESEVEQNDPMELEDGDEILYETPYEDFEEHAEEEKVEIVYFPNDTSDIKTPIKSPKPQELSREDKFIQAVYPQFKGRTKLQLIEEIMDLKRRNELLQTRAKTYENTINRLL